MSSAKLDPPSEALTLSVGDDISGCHAHTLVIPAQAGIQRSYRKTGFPIGSVAPLLPVGNDISPSAPSRWE